MKRISNEGLGQIAASHYELSLRSIYTEVSRDAPEMIKGTCRACPNLRFLHMRNDMTALDGDVIIQTVSQYCPFIEQLSTENWILTDAGLNALASVHTLKELKVSSDGCSSMACQHVLQSNPNLALLSICVEDVDEALVRCIGRYCRNLKHSDLTQENSSPLSDDALVELFRGCPLLELFDILKPDGISNVALSALFQHCPNIVELDLYVHILLADLPPAGGPILSTLCPSLTKFKVHGNGIAVRALRDIFTCCTNLREVELYKCRQLNDEVIELMAQNCPCLISLYARECANITVIGMLYIATRCSSLKALDLYHMPADDEFLIQLSLHCIGLISLCVNRCEGEPISEAGVLAVVEACTDLVSLEVRGNIVQPIAPTLELMQQGVLYPHIKFDLRH